uniref:GcvT family protein n=1 Tax=Marinobacterium profundum TaxID=1714300 RepID=UPI00082AE81D|nr:FAD-dependent oxidoreductase [Marinobacterium profundum]
MTTHSKVLVIGGGIAGVSTLYHLAKRGCTDIALVERTELTAGSTWHAAGNLPHFSTSINVMRLQQYSIDLYQRLEAETGQAVGHHKTGALRLAHTQERFEEFQRVAGMADICGLDFKLLKPEELQEYHPFLQTHDLVGGLWDPDDGHIDPTSVTNAMAKGARELGAKIHRNSPVSAISRDAKGVWQVETPQGILTADIIVNAAGFRANEVAAMIGHKLPMASMEHQYLVTEGVQEIADCGRELPMVRDPDVSYYLRQERDGFILGPYEPDGLPCWVDGVPPDFGQELFEPSLDRLEDIIATAMEQMPLLEKAGVQTVINGPITYTPDGHPLIGPIAGIDNYFVCTGFNFGIVQGGGAGHFMSQWILDGHPEIDLWELDPRRFGDYANARYSVAKACEVYAHEYANGFPYEYENRSAGRPAKTTPAYARLKENGGVFGARYGWERANWFAPEGVTGADTLSYRRGNWFETVGQECRAVRESVGLLDLSAFAKFEVSGPGAEAYLDQLSTNRLPGKVGAIALTYMVSNTGRIRAEFTITRLAEDRFYLVSAAGAHSHDWDELRRRLPADGSVTLKDETARYGTLVLAGPRARDLLAKLTSADLGNEAFPWLNARDIEVAGAPVRALRVNYVGERGWELHHPIEYQLGLYDALMEAGSEFGIRNFGLRAMDSLRLEKAYPMWGHELTCENTPIEAGLEFFVKTEGRSFTGRDALAGQRIEGTGVRLAYLEIDARDADAFTFEPVLADGKVVGAVSSGAYAHTLGKSLAFAYLKIAQTVPGTELEVLILGERCAARVIDAPAFDPKNRRPRGFYED